MQPQQREDVLRLIQAYLVMVANKYGGETTLNELRVMNRMIHIFFDGKSSGVTELSNELGIPKSTVSRSVMNLMQAGHLVESDDPNDRRRRVISCSPLTIDDLRRESKFLRDAFDGAKQEMVPDR